MKTLNIPLEDKEYELLKEAKGNLTWRDFIMLSLKEEKGEENKRI